MEPLTGGSHAEYKRACKGEPLHFICRDCFTPVHQSTALDESSLVHSDVDAEMTDVSDVYSSVNSDVDAEMTDVQSSVNSDVDEFPDTSVSLSLPFVQPSIYVEASLLDPRVPRDHVEDVAVTFTLIPVDSQKGKDLIRILISLYRAGTLSTSGLLKRCSTFYRPVVPKIPEEVEMNK
ncbi:hypothetical protein DPMN_023094 [Dreissena polymorpha]|uniref:Uncharacterized protein n=1 Tax=Dreissena polymorpha TaxID=45954 RepID=A0A9D4LMD2_DREPO|nr:hypothetical protein DPMN_023094 [Dreissena polymorpha]